MKKKQESLDRLKQLIPPPDHPYETGPASRREAIEESLGTALPEDQYRIGRQYGSGIFGGSGNTRIFYIYNPFSKAFVKKVKEWSESYRSLKETKSERAFPYAIYPESPGLLPCGNGERRELFWLTDGSPEEWPLVLLDPEDRFHRFDLSLTDFLFQLFSGKLDCYGGGLDTEWFKVNKTSFTFKPDRPRRKRRKA